MGRGDDQAVHFHYRWLARWVRQRVAPKKVETR